MSGHSSLSSIHPPFLAAALGQSECFDQQYTNNAVDLRSLHVIQRIAVVAPLSAFHVHFGISDEHDDVVKRENSAPLIVHSSVSSAHVDWHPVNVLAKKIAIESLFQDAMAVSPVIILTACPYRSFPFIHSITPRGLQTPVPSTWTPNRSQWTPTAWGSCRCTRTS